MAKTLLEKMFLKPEYATAILRAPEELQNELKTNKTDNELAGSYNFVLAFYTKKETIEKELEKLKSSLENNALLWIAYPKAKALQTDLNRDILHETAKKFGLDGVSIVSLNTTWSAMRFKI
jgi:hypothetical protein